MEAVHQAGQVQVEVAAVQALQTLEVEVVAVEDQVGLIFPSVVPVVQVARVVVQVVEVLHFLVVVAVVPVLEVNLVLLVLFPSEMYQILDHTESTCSIRLVFHLALQF